MNYENNINKGKDLTKTAYQRYLNSFLLTSQGLKNIWVNENNRQIESKFSELELNQTYNELRGKAI